VKQPKETNSAGRVDLVAARAFDVLLARHGNPGLRVVCRAFGDEIEQCFFENLGPGTKVHRIGARLLRAMGEGK
jgi:hypothetical protein